MYKSLLLQKKFSVHFQLRPDVRTGKDNRTHPLRLFGLDTIVCDEINTACCSKPKRHIEQLDFLACSLIRLQKLQHSHWPLNSLSRLHLVSGPKTACQHVVCIFIGFIMFHVISLPRQDSGSSSRTLLTNQASCFCILEGGMGDASCQEWESVWSQCHLVQTSSVYASMTPFCLVLKGYGTASPGHVQILPHCSRHCQEQGLVAGLEKMWSFWKWHVFKAPPKISAGLLAIYMWPQFIQPILRHINHVQTSQDLGCACMKMMCSSLVLPHNDVTMRATNLLVPVIVNRWRTSLSAILLFHTIFVEP